VRAKLPMPHARRASAARGKRIRRAHSAHSAGIGGLAIGADPRGCGQRSAPVGSADGAGVSPVAVQMWRVRRGTMRQRRTRSALNIFGSSAFDSSDWLSLHSKPSNAKVWNAYLSPARVPRRRQYAPVDDQG
jgi:hypothetical protein